MGLGFAAATLAACRDAASPGEPLRAALRPSHLVDLTHTLSPEFPFIPVQNKTFPFRISPIATVAGDGVYANRWELTEHVGTHLDAPSHFVEGGRGVDQLAIQSLIAPLAVVSIADRARSDPDAALERADLVAWERTNGRLPDGVAVFLHTGWELRVDPASSFVNMDARGVMHFPGYTEQAVEFLIADRRIAGIGIDTLSIDPGRDTKYPVHKRLFAAGSWAVECLANLGRVPVVGASVFVAPVKVRGASGAPARVIAFW
jgi:kynurenine formamidase